MSEDRGGNGRLLAEIIETLATVAPEVRELNLDPALPLREQIELDSMDHLHFLVGLKQRLGVDVPEAQYKRMHKLDDLVAYLRAHRGGGAAAAAD